MKRLVFLAAPLILLASGIANANDGSVWKGLMFDQSTIEDAINAAGQPSKRGREKIKVVDEAKGVVVGTEDLQIVEFKNKDEWKKVSLGFLKNKLYKAKFWPRNKTLPASEIPGIYRADFVAVEGFAKGVSLSVFEGKKEPEVPRVYPTVYFMISAIPDRYILASINNGSWGSLWKDAFKKATVEMFPGFVEDIQIVSRKREKS
jgi:hypothetical protein